MADQKITQLTATTTLTGTDIIPVVTSVPTVPVSKKITTSNLMISLGITDGWVNPFQTWTYASATTITVPSGAGSIYAVGDKIKLTQTTVKYFYIIGVADTLLTITGGSDYTLTNTAISANYYSHAVSPVGFPGFFNYTPTTAGLTSPVIGSSAGQFSIYGKTITSWGKIDITSYSGQSGSVTVTPPVTLSTAGATILGTASYYRGGGGSEIGSKAVALLSGTQLGFMSVNQGGATSWDTTSRTIIQWTINAVLA